MPPKKKQTPKNAFFFFMEEFKEKQQNRGKSFPGGWKDVAEAASPSWMGMNSDEKKYYEELAKAWKAEQRGDASMKYTTTGVSYAEVDAKLKEEEDERNLMISTIERDIMNLTSKKALESKFFYLIHVNWYCMTSSHIYLPAEIGICEMSLITGVNRTYHTFVNPGSPPTGYRLSAQEHLESTHQIPLDYAKGDSHFSKILRDIKNFIKGDKSFDEDLPPVYTMPDSINHNTSISAVKSTLQMLTDNEMVYSDRHRTPKFRVFLLEKLFFELRNACAQLGENGECFPTTGIPTMELEKEVFNSNSSLACEFHQSNDRSIYCSLSKVKGWAFIICDFCCEDLQIGLIPGRHCPELADKQYLQRTSNYEKPASPNAWKTQSPPRKPKLNPEEPAWGLPKPDHVNPWKTHRVPAEDQDSSEASVNSRPSHETSLSSLMTGSSPRLDFSEESFPSMGRGLGHARGRTSGVKRISSGMRGMRLNKQD